ncbi:MAG: acyl carrier protein [Nitrospinae bacterium]|nr:acyl carrier protein [Nitrospinota bacterium]
MAISEEKIVETVKQVIVEALRIEPQAVTLDACLVDDLGAESLDFIDIAFRLERTFQVELLRETLLDKAAEIVGEGVLEQQGALTASGAELLRRRMPEVNPARIPEGLPVEDVNRLFTVRTWVRAVQEVLDAQPTRCPTCGAATLAVTKPRHINLTLTCGACGGEVSPPSGEALAERWIRAQCAQVLGQR